MRPPLRDDLAGAEPYGAPQLEVPVVLNVNENPYPPSSALASAMAEAVVQTAKGLNRYPDREATALRQALADYLGEGLTASQVWAANGSNEIMQQLCQAFGGPGRTVLTFTPTYSMYPEYARNTFTAYVTEPRREDFTVDAELVLSAVERHQPTLVLLARPNNPTGTGIELQTIAEICAGTRALVVVDEAYQEFSTAPSAVTLLAAHPNLIVSRTMSKAFALAGGRVGYLAAAKEIVDACRIVRLPYHLSAQTQTIAHVALQHRDELLAQVRSLAEGVQEFERWLSGRGYDVVASQANFILFGRFVDRHAVWQGLLERGVLIRETGPEGYLRASAGTPEEMARLRAALDDTNPELVGGERPRP